MSRAASSCSSANPADKQRGSAYLVNKERRSRRSEIGVKPLSKPPLPHAVVVAAKISDVFKRMVLGCAYE